MKPYSFTFSAMTVPCDILLYERSQAAANELAQAIFSSTKRLESRYNFHDAKSWLSKAVNEASGGYPVPNRHIPKTRKIRLDNEGLRVFRKIRHLSEATEGLFDVTVGTLTRAAKLLPHHSKAELEEMLGTAMGLDAWSVKGSELHIYHPETRFDLGGVIKEYAVDEAASLVRSASGGSVISYGGDMRVSGRKPNGDFLKVGIRNPQNTDSILASLAVEDVGIATSGNYERSVLIGGQRSTHIIGARLSHAVQSATVIGESALESGVYSTVLMINPEHTLPNHLQQILVDHHGKLYGNVNAA